MTSVEEPQESKQKSESKESQTKSKQTSDLYYIVRGWLLSNVEHGTGLIVSIQVKQSSR